MAGDRNRGHGIHVRDAGRLPARGPWAAFLDWFGRDVVLRRLALVGSGLLGLFILGYVLVHVILLAPVLVLAAILLAYGLSGRGRRWP